MATFEQIGVLDTAVANETATALAYNDNMSDIKTAFNNLAGGLKHQTLATGEVDADGSAEVSVSFSGSIGVGDETNWSVVATVVDDAATEAALRLHHIKDVSRTGGLLTATVVVSNDDSEGRSGTLHAMAMKDTS